MTKQKIFAIGFNKSGTTSLHSLFISLGLRSYHGVQWRACDDPSFFHAYDCFSDDVPRDLAKLDKWFPDSRFILQVRELEGWLYSRLSHIERKKKDGTYVGKAEWDCTEYAVKQWIEKRNAYHLFVLEYFFQRKADLLIVNFIRDISAATKVCNFLGYKGEYDRPRENIDPGRVRPIAHVELVRKCMVDLGITEGELHYDILCPSMMDTRMASEYPADSSMIIPHSL